MPDNKDSDRNDLDTNGLDKDGSKDNGSGINRSNKRKFYLQLILGVFVIASFFVSMKSCSISSKAQKTAAEALETAAEALETSKRQFIQLNRPHITIAPEKFQNELYWIVIQKDRLVEIQIQFKIQNVGNVAAKNLCFPDELSIEPMEKAENGRDSPNTINNHKPFITMAPGESKIYSVNSSMVYENSALALDNINYLHSEQSHGVEIEFYVQYENELNALKKFKTSVHHRIKKDSVQLLKSVTAEIIK